MIKQGRGRIINLVSGLASMASPRFSASCFWIQGLWIRKCRPKSEVWNLRNWARFKDSFMDLKDKDLLRQPQQVAEIIAALAKWDRSKDSGKDFSVWDLSGVKTGSLY